jgi:hypothetical protein
VPKRSGKAEVSKRTDGSEAVEKFLRELDHPLKPVVEAVRRTILGANPNIGEGIKWNAPSFHFKEYFATAGLRSKDFVHVIFHKGAKFKDNCGKRVQIRDPKGMLEWLANERCAVKFFDLRDIKKKERALQDIVKQWIKQM